MQQRLVLLRMLALAVCVLISAQGVYAGASTQKRKPTTKQDIKQMIDAVRAKSGLAPLPVWQPPHQEQQQQQQQAGSEIDVKAVHAGRSRCGKPAAATVLDMMAEDGEAGEENGRATPGTTAAATGPNAAKNRKKREARKRKSGGGACTPSGSITGTASSGCASPAMRRMSLDSHSGKGHSEKLNAKLYYLAERASSAMSKAASVEEVDDEEAAAISRLLKEKSLPDEVRTIEQIIHGEREEQKPRKAIFAPYRTDAFATDKRPSLLPDRMALPPITRRQTRSASAFSRAVAKHAAAAAAAAEAPMESVMLSPPAPKTLLGGEEGEYDYVERTLPYVENGKSSLGVGLPRETIWDAPLTYETPDDIDYIHVKGSF